MNKKVILAAVVAVVLLAIAWWWFGGRPGIQPAGTDATADGQNGLPPQAVQQSDQSLGASIYSQVEAGKNPADSIPDTNPMGDSANPIKDAYNNPFGQ